MRALGFLKSREKHVPDSTLHKRKIALPAVSLNNLANTINSYNSKLHDAHSH